MTDRKERLLSLLGTRTQCANCNQRMSARQGGDGASFIGVAVCCQACGFELLHRLLLAVPGVLGLLPKDEVSIWRGYRVSLVEAATRMGVAK